jgi:two-component system response regulator RegX3
MPLILLVDDEEPLRASLTFTLIKEGFAVTTAADGPTALQLVFEKSPDVILLDLMLPGMDGIEVCQRIRERSDVPILMLTARDHVSDKVQGLEIGADDYVTKPFNSRELLARIRTVIRRRESAERLLREDRELLERMEDLLPSDTSPQTRPAALPLAQHGVLTGGPVRMDIDREEVTVNGRRITLAPPELQLLRALLSHQGRVVTRTELIEASWQGKSKGDIVRLEAHIRCLRDKIEADPANPRYILTVPGIGYRFG